MLSGQAIIAKAKEAVKEVKKMHGLMSVTVKEGAKKLMAGNLAFHPVALRMTLTNGC